MDAAEAPDLDRQHMERCLTLALQAEGRTAPNPIVGAVVLDRDGNVVGEGFHAKAGQPHAEVMALRAAGDRARGGTIYVSLEPCCHHGRTGPCTDAVTASGVTRVVAGLQDPNPAVNGSGAAILRHRGITVDMGILQDECAWVNRGFITRILKKRPWVCLKLATTLDGRIADRNGSSRWITSPEARRYVHEMRNTHDAVLIGSQTAKYDDPELNVRDIEGGRNPHRIVLDTHLNVSPEARMFQPVPDSSRSIIFCNKEPEVFAKLQKLPQTVSVMRAKTLPEKPNQLDLVEVFSVLGAQEINSILCEGGGKLAGALLAAGLVDEVRWIIAPKLLNDREGVPALGLDNNVTLTDALKLHRVKVSQLGADVLIEGTIGVPEFLTST